MRTIDINIIVEVIKNGFIKANYILPEDITGSIKNAYSKEHFEPAKSMLNVICENISIASQMEYPLCQDTGMAVVFCEIGQDIHITNGLLTDAINRGVEAAYKDGYLRKSVVADPLRRVNTGNNTPAVIHTEIVSGDSITFYLLPKGFGAENQSAIRMFVPSDTYDDIVSFIANGVIKSGGKGCPPSVIGVGIGGTFEYAAYLSKKALLRDINNSNPDPFYEKMENDILQQINRSGIGTMGAGGDTTVLGVNILTYPTHIAGLPVAYNYCCHSARHTKIII